MACDPADISCTPVNFSWVIIKCVSAETQDAIIIASFQTEESWVQVPCIMGYSTGQVSSLMLIRLIFNSRLKNY